MQQNDTSRCLHMGCLPDGVLAVILRRTLDPEHPGSLIHQSYVSKSWHKLVYDHFSTAALLSYLRGCDCTRVSVRQEDPSTAAWSARPPMLECMLVYKRWHRLVFTHDIVLVVAAAAAPAGLPPSVRTLITTVPQSLETMHAFAASLKKGTTHSRQAAGRDSAGLVQLRTVVCCDEWPYKPQPSACFTHGKASEDDGPLFWERANALVACLSQLPALTALHYIADGIDGDTDTRPFQDAGSAAVCIDSAPAPGPSDAEPTISALGRHLSCVQRLHGLTTLRLHCLCHNAETADALALLSACLTSLSGLKALDLSGTSFLDCEEECPLAPVLASMPALDELVIEEAFMRMDCAVPLVRSLATSSSLRSLSLAQTRVGLYMELEYFEEEADQLRNDFAKHICACTLLRDLNLHRCALGKECIEPLTQRLSALTVLEVLRLGHNEGEDAAGLALAECLPTLTSLKKLELGSPVLGSPGYAAISSAACVPILDSCALLTGLCALDLSGVHFGPGTSELMLALRRLTLLTYLDLRSVGHFDAGMAQHMVAAISALPSLEWLGFDVAACNDGARYMLLVLFLHKPLLKLLYHPGRRFVRELLSALQEPHDWDVCDMHGRVPPRWSLKYVQGINMDAVFRAQAFLHAYQSCACS